MKRFYALTLVTLGWLATDALAQAEFNLPMDHPLRRVVVQHTGRLQPLDTLARDLVLKVTGEKRGSRAIVDLLDWTYDLQSARQTEMIPVGNRALREALELPADQSRFSLLELAAHEPLTRRITQLRSGGMSGMGKGDPLQRKVSGIAERLEALASILTGRAILCIPDPQDPVASWMPVSVLREGMPPAYDAVRTNWQRVLEANHQRDAAALLAASNDLLTSLNALPAASRLSDEKIDLELSHNALKPFSKAWQVLWIGAILAVIGAVYASRTGKSLWVLDVLALLAFVGGFAFASVGLWQRGVIAGRLPAANMFESLLFLSWGAALASVIAAGIVAVARTWRPLLLTSGIMGAVTLTLADLLPLDQFLRPIAPVLLDTAWMAIHVPVIMVSYAVLTIAVAFAHAQLAVLALKPGATKLANRMDRLHYLYAFVGSLLLIIGIFTGSMWGAASWGRYWGWDPKEVWSLIAFLGYMVILHVRIDRQAVPLLSRLVAAILAIGVLLQIAKPMAPLSGIELGALCAACLTALIFLLTTGAFATAVKSILAFWLIVMTYVGVNFVLGTGLHSYGFGAGPVVIWMYRLGSADLGFVLLMTVLYLVRSRSRQTAEGPAPSGAATT